jgi:hypothetical protein
VSAGEGGVAFIGRAGVAVVALLLADALKTPVVDFVAVLRIATLNRGSTDSVPAGLVAVAEQVVCARGPIGHGFTHAFPRDAGIGDAVIAEVAFRVIPTKARRSGKHPEQRNEVDGIDRSGQVIIKGTQTSGGRITAEA